MENAPLVCVKGSCVWNQWNEWRCVFVEAIVVVVCSTRLLHRNVWPKLPRDCRGELSAAAANARGAIVILLKPLTPQKKLCNRLMTALQVLIDSRNSTMRGPSGLRAHQERGTDFGG